MGKKLIDELREKVRKKHECVIEESKKIKATLATIQNRVDAINNEATVAADSLLKERNKEKLKGKYTEVMQQLEQCSNVLFLINSSLPGNAEEDGDSSSSSDADDAEDPVGGATSTPQCSYLSKPDLSPSFIPDTSSQFNLQDTSKLGLTTCFKEDAAVVKEEHVVVKQEQESRDESTLKQQGSMEDVKGKGNRSASGEELEEGQGASVLKREHGQGASVVKLQQSQAASVLKQDESKHPAVSMKEEGESEGAVLTEGRSKVVSASTPAQDTGHTAPGVSSTGQSTETETTNKGHSQIVISGQKTENPAPPKELWQQQYPVEDQEQGETYQTGSEGAQASVSEPQRCIKIEPCKAVQCLEEPTSQADTTHTETQHMEEPIFQADTRHTETQRTEEPTSQCPAADTKHTEMHSPVELARAKLEEEEEDLSRTFTPVTSYISDTAPPEAAASQQQISNTDDNKPVKKHKDNHETSQTVLVRAESPMSDRSETRSVKSDKVRPHRPKRVVAKAPSTRTLPSSRASSVAGETLEPSGRIPPLEIVPDKEYGVCIQVVESPWLLWVQPFNEDFDDLIDSMSTYYEHLGVNDARRNLNSPPVVGMYVCSRYSANGDWYRAIITHIYQLKGEESRATYVPRVRVFYIDFGNSEDRSVEEVRPLLRRFCELPAHAVPCALAEVAPLVDGVQWTKNESLAILLTLKNNESLGLNHAVFRYELGCPLWFVHIYVPQAVPLVHIHARSGPITQEMICVSEHLVNTKLARRLPNDKIVKRIKRMKLTESGSEDVRYVATSKMELKSLISTLSPVQPGSGDSIAGSKTTEGEKGTASQGPSDRGDVKETQAKSLGTPATLENPPNLTRSKYSPRARQEQQRTDQGQKGGNKQDESQASLYQEWAQAWKNVSDPGKDKQPAVQCSTSLSSSARNPHDTKSPPQKPGFTETKTKTEFKTSGAKTQERTSTTKGDQPRGSHPPTHRPTSDHQHVRIPLAEIAVGPDQRVAFLMSHIESPSLFFIHPVAERTQLLIDRLAEELEEYYGEANLETMQRYFHSANLEVHDACVAFYSEDNSYYRAEILNTSRPSRTSSVSGDSMSSSDMEQVEVLYVDYGNREWVSLNKVYPIQPKLSSIPAQAVCCRLSHVVPAEPDPEVTLSYNHGGWLKEAVHWFRDSTGYNKKFVGTVEAASSTKRYSVTDPLPMLLVDETDDHGARCLNLELARLGMAKITELPQMSSLAMGPNQKKPGSPTSMENSALDEWCPMEEDFLSIRNSYQVNTEDANVAVTGVECLGDKTICKYYARGMRCWLGALCRDKHVRPNPDVCEDQVPAVVMYSDENIVTLPEANTWVRLEVLSVVNPSRFYAYLPYGVLPIHADVDTPPAAIEFLKLRDVMTEFYEEHPFEHQDLTLYAEGEIVAAKCDDDHYWYRCRVIQVDPDNSKVKVFFLDFGNTVWQKERYIKQIDTQFLFVPFQAIECHLEIKPTGDTWTTQAINEFVGFVDGKELVAMVIERLGTRLTVDLTDTSHERTEVNVAERFIQLGHARRIILPNQTPATMEKRNKRYRMVPG